MILVLLIAAPLVAALITALGAGRDGHIDAVVDQQRDAGGLRDLMQLSSGADQDGGVGGLVTILDDGGA